MRAYDANGTKAILEGLRRVSQRYAKPEAPRAAAEPSPIPIGPTATLAPGRQLLIADTIAFLRSNGA